MKRVLMVAFHFPPLAGSSGIQRTLRFVQELPALGWEPIVISARPQVYERTSDDLMSEVPTGIVVRRAFGFDTARHLALGGRYPGFAARPDRWMTWRFDAVRTGMQLIETYRPQALWSTYPIATAHLIGAHLQRRSGLPWVADFRDPMAQDGYPPDPKVWRSFKSIEEQVFDRAAAAMFTTPSAMRSYGRSYPRTATRMALIENGYDEGSFRAIEQSGAGFASLRPGAITLLHSGIVYPSERDPTQLFLALRRLADEGVIAPGNFLLRMRAPVHDGLVLDLARQQRIEPMVEVCAPIAYRDALQEMMCADGLLVMQAANCNEQIPAKVYEYLRARRPIVCLSDPAGDTEHVLRRSGLDTFARLDSADEIAAALSQWLAQARAGRATRPDDKAVIAASRRGRAQQLVELLDTVTAPN